MPICKTIEAHGNKALIWTDDVESEALAQIHNVLSLPFIFKHIAVMPDVHKGWGCPVGSVIATIGKVMPACVGVDIGCGMCAVKISLKADALEGKLLQIRSSIERVIPLGFNGNKVIQNEVYEWRGWSQWSRITPGVHDLKKKALEQMGSLGGGNHFIEICLGEESSVWVMLHSGSRHIGKALADCHVAAAKKQMREKGINLPDSDLAYLSEGTREFQSYVHDASWAQDYAEKNREIMMNRILGELCELLNDGRPITRLLSVNCHHNYVTAENHFGKNVFVTRKGALRTRRDEWAIIPGSMGASSFIVRGLGNQESFDSSSHGAGRRMSRHEALRRFTSEDLRRETDGVECRKDKGVLDEIPSAYKNIDEVMENQKDLVKIDARLKQLVCIKG